MTTSEAPPTSSVPAAAPPTRRTGAWKQVLLGLIILVSGMALGAGGTIIVGRRMFIRQIEGQRNGWLTRSITQRLTSDLGLSLQQTTQVQAIVKRRLEAVGRIREESRPQVEEQFKLMRSEINSVLDARQAKLWRDQFDRMQRARPHPPYPPRGMPFGPGRPYGGRWGPYRSPGGGHQPSGTGQPTPSGTSSPSPTPTS